MLIRRSGSADLPALAARHPGSAVVATGGLTRRLAADLAVSAWLNKLLVGVMVGYAALAAANTMVIAALAAAPGAGRAAAGRVSPAPRPGGWSTPNRPGCSASRS